MNVLTWVQTLISHNPTASTKRMAYIIVVIASVIWLSINLYTAGISELWVLSFQTLIASVGIGYVGGTVVEKINSTKKTDDDTTIPTEEEEKSNEEKVLNE